MFGRILKNKKSNLLMILSLVFISLISIFPVGLLHSSTLIENTAEYLADVAENHTVNSKYLALSIEPNDKTEKKVNNPYNDFLYLYGIFKERLATYVGTANAEKSHSVKLLEIDEDVNFSFLNVDTGFGVKEYYKDKDGYMVYKQEFYPLELMFYSNHPGVEGQYSFFYISQTRATAILEKRGLPHETRDDYKTLLNTLTDVEIDGINYKFAIDNIYLERNYFYDALNEVIGEFFLAGQRYPDSIKRQGLFYLRNYPYQNKYLIEFATKLYSTDEFNFRVLNYNFKDNFTINESKLIFVTTTDYDVFPVLLLLLLIVVLLLSLVFICFGAFEFTFKNNLIVIGFSFTPYIIFWIAHFFSSSALLFSNFSTSCEMWCLIGFFVLYAIIYLIKRSQKQVA